MIRQEDGKFRLYTKDGSKVLGTHDTYEKALKQEQAVQISKHKKKASVVETLIGKLAAAGVWRDTWRTDASGARYHVINDKVFSEDGQMRGLVSQGFTPWAAPQAQAHPPVSAPVPARALPRMWRVGNSYTTSPSGLSGAVPATPEEVAGILRGKREHTDKAILTGAGRDLFNSQSSQYGVQPSAQDNVLYAGGMTGPQPSADKGMLYAGGPKGLQPGASDRLLYAGGAKGIQPSANPNMLYAGGPKGVQPSAASGMLYQDEAVAQQPQLSPKEQMQQALVRTSKKQGSVSEAIVSDLEKVSAVKLAGAGELIKHMLAGAGVATAFGVAPALANAYANDKNIGQTLAAMAQYAIPLGMMGGAAYYPMAKVPALVQQILAAIPSKAQLISLAEELGTAAANKMGPLMESGTRLLDNVNANVVTPVGNAAKSMAGAVGDVASGVGSAAQDVASFYGQALDDVLPGRIPSVN